MFAFAEDGLDDEYLQGEFECLRRCVASLQLKQPTFAKADADEQEATMRLLDQAVSNCKRVRRELLDNTDDPVDDHFRWIEEANQIEQSLRSLSLQLRNS
ncbi:hypothetical protein AAVH_21901 [Aphelenchoides avenae]|nr:hypothetical protein AAVH_21901 [Aphelenchus avenae]